MTISYSILDDVDVTVMEWEAEVMYWIRAGVGPVGGAATHSPLSRSALHRLRVVAADYGIP